ncbi:hypothetical protein OB13_01655 [Pontibacter sp. HJ8]|jgi:hypothetical protein
MWQFYKNTGYVIAIFLLAVLMQYLRCDALTGGNLLMLGSLFGGGLVAGLLGSSQLIQEKEV